MRGYEPYRQQQLYDEQYDSETNTMDAYHPTMESFDFNTSAAFNPMPFSFAEAPMDMKYNDMVRTISTGSAHHTGFDMAPTLLHSGSIGSSSSSTVGSPFSAHVNIMPSHEDYPMSNLAFAADPTIVGEDGFQQDFFTGPLGYPEDNKMTGSYVDPMAISGHNSSYYHSSSSTLSQPSHHTLSVSPAPSPVPSHHSYHAFGQPLTVENYPSQQRNHHRRLSTTSQRSGSSPRTSVSGDEETTEKGRCPWPECGKIYKDLKAHKLTHMAERPEKCPILTCEYNTKGFARKYDKNRHTLTHYKGTMVCGFCPGSGSPAEKSFNRADVFKRHLTSVHGVEQNPPNSRKRSPGSSSKKLSSYCEDATGKCSTCSVSFSNAQDFYEHLDDCVLRVVQQEDPREAVNAQHLADIEADPSVLETMERNNVKVEDMSTYDFDEEEDDDDEDEDDEDDDDDDDDDDEEPSTGRVGVNSKKRAIIGGNISKKKFKRAGLTWSKGGPPRIGRSRRRRKNYPQSWGMPADKMKKKKRVLCVYEGSRRLLKDDMMLFNEHEVRIRLDGNNYVTDLDIETLKRAEAFHNATEEEKGPWAQDTSYLDLLS